jgi:hypothetical protein
LAGTREVLETKTLPIETLPPRILQTKAKKSAKHVDLTE